ncbi:MAG: photosynthetic complex assembly protein PuhC [Alphaproteobacteria bacterium]
MSNPFEGEQMPRWPLIGAAALIGLAFILAISGRMDDARWGPEHLPMAVEERQLRFEDRDDGAVVVTDASTDGLVAVLEPGSNGFIRGVLRGLGRQRKRADVESHTPYRLAMLEDGHLVLGDPATGEQVVLRSFGPTNFQAFERLLHANGEALK